jgi:hypothetical protein
MSTELRSKIVERVKLVGGKVVLGGVRERIGCKALGV